jgi:5'-nucleotidase/UDP-sugar diphosphatase
VRNRSTRLAEILTRAMLASAPGAQWSINNSGTIRIDDVIQPGPVTEYDVVRILPFGGNIVAVDMTGGLLQKVLDQGQANKALGGYLQHARSRDQPIQPERTYVVAIAQFLLSGREIGLEFMKDHPGLRRRSVGGTGVDMRRVLIAELGRTYPPGHEPVSAGQAPDSPAPRI